jgi:nitrilase
MDKLPKFIAAAVQAAPVYMDREATIEKARQIIVEAAGKGAKLIAFPEVFVPGYPYWNWIDIPFAGTPWFVKLCENSVDLTANHLDPLLEEARRQRVTVVIGINERSAVSLGTIYNSNVVIGDNGTILGVHRKLVPTWAERLTWANGDGSSLRIYKTPVGPLGTLACGENTNTLARFALMAQGELVHVANYPAFPFGKNLDMPKGIQVRAGAHSFEGKLFTVVSCSVLSPEMIDVLADTPAKRDLLSGALNACSGIFGPDGTAITELLIDKEGIVYGEIDLSACIAPKQFHDIIGHYNRFDIFKLSVDRRAQHPVHLIDSIASPIRKDLEVRTSSRDGAGQPAEPSLDAAE